MAHLSVVQAVEARLEAGFSGPPIYVENSIIGTPDDGGDFILLHFPVARAEWTSADEFTEEGGFEIVLSTTRDGGGTHRARAWLDEIAALFRGEAFEGVQCYAPTSPVSDDRSDAGAYFRLRMAVPYEFIITQPEA